MFRVVSVLLYIVLGTHAALAQAAGPLAPGKPAGVRQAQAAPLNLAFVGIAVLVLGVGLYLASKPYQIPGQPQTTSPTGTGN